MKRPAFQFYAKDWRGNLKLRRCSDAAKGAWIEIMCVLHDSEEYGVARFPLRELVAAAGVQPKSVRELVEKGVLKGGDRDVEAYRFTPSHAGKKGAPVTLLDASTGPMWYSSRFVRDEYKRQNAGAETRFGAPPREPPSTPPKADPGTERARLRAAVLAKTEGQCAHCKATLGKVWEIDHLVPRSKGGSNKFENLVPACVGCNQDKADTMPTDWSPPSRTPSHRDGDGSAIAVASASSNQQLGVGLAGETAQPVDNPRPEGRKSTPRAHGNWRHDPDAAAAKLRELGLEPGRGELMPDCVRRIERAIEEQRRTERIEQRNQA